MRAVIQRVKRARVTVEGSVVGNIGPGIVVLLGVGKDDNDSDINYMVEKIPNLRIFEDEQGKMNKSLIETGGEILLVSQFTLYGDCRKGRRPGFTDAAGPEKGNAFYQQVVKELKAKGIRVETGVFQAEMLVEIINDGPVTILLDSARIF